LYAAALRNRNGGTPTLSLYLLADESKLPLTCRPSKTVGTRALSLVLAGGEIIHGLLLHAFTLRLNTSSSRTEESLFAEFRWKNSLKMKKKNTFSKCVPYESAYLMFIYCICKLTVANRITVRRV